MYKEKKAVTTGGLKKKLLSSAIALASSASQFAAATCANNVSGSTGSCNITQAQTVTITNSGSINTTANSGTAIGVSTPDIGVAIRNSGSISANASGGTSANLYGINSSVDFAGSINNSGSISAEAAPSSGYATAYAINIGGDLAGNVNNSGTISANAHGSGSGASAFAIDVSNLDGALNNSGTISANARAATSAVYAEAINTDTVNGSIINSGTIEAIADGSNTAIYANAITIDTRDINHFENSGTISAIARNATSSVQAEALEFYDITGDFINRGTISAYADGASSASYASAYSIEADDIDGNFTNTGTIESKAEGGNSWNSAYAMDIGDIDGAFVNEGTISATATANNGASGASAYGVETDNINGSFLNTGTIRATSAGTGSAGSAYAYALDTRDIAGTFENRGLIEATASLENGTSYASAYAVDTWDIEATGSFLNSGTIRATAVHAGASDSDAQAYAVDHSNIDGQWTNTGTIEAIARHAGSSDASAYGVYMSTVNGTVLNSGTISANAHNSGTASAFVSAVSGYEIGVNGSITNTGTISALAVQDAYSSSASAYGVYFFRNHGQFTNSGTISAEARSSYDPEAYGVSIYQISATGSFVNTENGLISAIAGPGSSSAGATGVAINSTIEGSFENKGTISASASGATYVQANGVYYNSASGSFANNGVISAAVAGTSSIDAYGVQSNGNSGSFTNSGVINVKANGSSFVNATGVALGNLSGSFENNGSIAATANGYSFVFATGVDVSNNTGTFVNNGTISAKAISSSSVAQAIALEGTGGSYVNNGTIIGAINVTGDLQSPGTHYVRIGNNKNLNASTISGTADYSGGSLGVYADEGHGIEDGDVFNNAITAGTLITESTTPALTDNLAMYEFSADTMGGNSLSITATRLTADSLVGGAFSTPASIIEQLNAGTPTNEITQLMSKLESARSIQEMNDVLASNVMPAAGGQTSTVSNQITTSVNRLIQSEVGQRGGQASGDQPSGDSAWLRVMHDDGKRSGDMNSVGYEVEGVTAVFGMDTDIGDGNMRVGVALAVNDSNVNPHAGAAIDVDSTAVSLYGHKMLDESTYLNMQLALGYGDNEIAAGSRFDSHTYSLYAAYGRSYTLSEKDDGKWRVTPEINATYLNVHESGYQNGMVAVQSANQDALELGIGAKLNYEKSERLDFTGMLGYAYNTDDNIKVGVDLNGTNFDISTENEQNSLVAGIGLRYLVTDGRKLEIDYERNERGDFSNDRFSAKFRWDF